MLCHSSVGSNKSAFVGGESSARLRVTANNAKRKKIDARDMSFIRKMMRMDAASEFIRLLNVITVRFEVGKF